MTATPTATRRPVSGLDAHHPDLGNPYTLWVAVHDQPGG